MSDVDISPEAAEHLCGIHREYGRHGTVATLRAQAARIAALEAEQRETAGHVRYWSDRLEEADEGLCFMNTVAAMRAHADKLDKIGGAG